MKQNLKKIPKPQTNFLNPSNTVTRVHPLRWWIMVFTACLPWLAQAQPLPDWSVNTPNTVAVALAVDGSNNSFVGSVDSTGASMLTKVGPSGAMLWQRGLTDATHVIRISLVTVDGAGNAIVTGRLLDAAGNSQGPVVMMWDPAGILLWQVITPSPYSYSWRAVSDAAGNVFVVATMFQTLATGALVSDVTVTSYTHTGALRWSQSFGARLPSTDPIIITSTGNIVVSGLASNGAGTIVAAFSPSGTALWTTAVPSNGPLALAAGRVGEFYAVGDGGSAGFLVIKFDAAFNQAWSNVYPARGVASRAAVDSAGNLVVVGSVDTNTGQLTVVMSDWLTIKLDTNGTMLWSATYGTAAWFGDVPYALALGPDDAVYVTGDSSIQGTDAAGNITRAAATATVKYSPGGAPIWATATQQTTRSVDIKASTDGGVMVLGYSPNTLLRYPQSGLPNQPPAAVATAGPNLSGPAPLTVSFSAAGSSDPDGVIAGYSWNFGDGQTSTEANPSHAYAAGNWTAQLTVTDSLGASSSAGPIAIVASVPVLAPAKPRSITFAKTSVYEGATTTATLTMSTSSGAKVTLSSSDPKVATVPTSVVVPAGQTSATFTVSTWQVRKDTRVTIRATANGVSVSSTLTVLNR